MRLKALLADDENAVSPVIGVILMVAITVILAAVIASFVLGLGPSDAAPTTNFDSSFDSSTDELTVEVTGGDTVPVDQIRITGSNISNTNWPASDASGTSGGETAIQAGDTTVVVPGEGQEVNVVWESESGGTTQTLTTFQT